MAGYSDKREQNMEIKYLRKLLEDVDRNIAVPDGISGDALRPLLDEVAAPVGVGEMLRNLFRGGRPFSWQSGLSYAVAFALILALSFGLRSNYNGNVVGGQLDIQETEAAPEAILFSADLDAGADAGYYGDEMEMAAGEGHAVDGDAPADQALITENPVTAGSLEGGDGRGGRSSPVQDAAVDDSAAEDPSTGGGARPGVGGSGESTQIASMGSYVFAYRVNDANDPDKEHIPLTVDVVEQESGELVAQIDLEDMTAVTQAYAQADTLTLVGEGDGKLVVRAYSLADPEAPEETVAVFQAGEYVDSEMNGGVLHLVTRYEENEDPSCAIEALPDSVSEGGVIVAAVDTAGGVTAQKAFEGVNGEVRLTGSTLSVDYQRELEDGEQEVASAEIVLENTGIGSAKLPE